MSTPCTCGRSTPRTTSTRPRRRLTFTYAADTIAPTVAIAALPLVHDGGRGHGEVHLERPVRELRVRRRRGGLRALHLTARGDGGGSRATHRGSVRATDLAGQRRRGIRGHVDLPRRPGDDADGDPAGPSPSGPNATFEFTGSVSGTTFECQLDLGPWAACASPLVLTGLADGEHSLAVRGTADGFTDATPAEHTWTVDRRGTRHPAGDGDRQRARSGDHRDDGDVHLLVGRPRCRLRVPPRRWLVVHLREPVRARERSPRATTSSRSAPSTRRATSTRRRPATPGPLTARPRPPSPRVPTSPRR